MSSSKLRIFSATDTMTADGLLHSPERLFLKLTKTNNTELQPTLSLHLASYATCTASFPTQQKRKVSHYSYVHKGIKYSNSELGCPIG